MMMGNKDEVIERDRVFLYEWVVRTYARHYKLLIMAVFRSWKPGRGKPLPLLVGSAVIFGACDEQPPLGCGW